MRTWFQVWDMSQIFGFILLKLKLAVETYFSRIPRRMLEEILSRILSFMFYASSYQLYIRDTEFFVVVDVLRLIRFSLGDQTIILEF